MYNHLRRVPLFENLTDEALDELCQGAEVLHLQAGEELIKEGTQGDRAYVIQSGELEVVKLAHGQEVLLAVRGEGDLIGEMALLQQSPRTATVRARSDAEVLSIGFAHLDDLLNTNPAAARTMLQTMTSRWRATQALLRNSEKMAQLGSLAAGMAHELNNPSTAALRGSQQLKDALDRFQTSCYAIIAKSIDEACLATLYSIVDELAAITPAENDLDALARSDRENELEEWLAAHQIENGWEYAPILVDIAFDVARLESLREQFPADLLPAVIGWICSVYSVQILIAEIGEGARRITEMVNALKSYSFLDQAPTQSVDIHEGLNDTLLLLRNKLKKAIVVTREFDESLPEVHAHGSELNQVWTNIIDNAIQAMKGEGHLQLRTSQDDEHVIVEITDDGPGIPPEFIDHIFEPYFTSKSPGEGTGLGLDISRKIISEKHNGEIKVASRPGSTTFSIYLPKQTKQDGK